MMELYDSASISASVRLPGMTVTG
ncbi:MAG: hypothetical protein JWP21_1443, partial [Tardiphaga sp.]|nr:hypothetical protein [Tardiphaga sp.]